MSAIQNKRCPKCNLVDLTDFSKCRNCGARYVHAVVKTTQPGLGMGFWALAGGALVTLWIFQGPIITAVERVSGTHGTSVVSQ